MMIVKNVQKPSAKVSTRGVRYRFFHFSMSQLVSNRPIVRPVPQTATESSHLVPKKAICATVSGHGAQVRNSWLARAHRSLNRFSSDRAWVSTRGKFP
ncbi:hypothetical protein AB6A40_002407 [Gnathostoma spinigerum]|uniref:Uncharacterized protein n=1 Tax=Gnathostoma spinigerum TaxID=75299 RepID=A0ABD6E6H0_9BILA